jgi:hypothetical protein
MSESTSDLRTTLERVRWEVMALLSRTPSLELRTLYRRVREVLGEDTDMAVARVISALLRAHVICMEPLQATDPNAGWLVSITDPAAAGFAF